MLRRLRLSLLAGLGCGIAATGAAAAGDAAAGRIVMPFSCVVDGGRLKVTPSARRQYAIVGPRDEQGIRICVSGATKCRAVTVHRFSIACGEARVPWMKVVVATRAFGLGRTWISNGRLNVMWKSPRTGGACGSAPPVGFTLPFFQNGHSKSDCTSGNSAHRVLLPAGFAPLTEIGARLFASPAVVDEQPEPPSQSAPPPPVATVMAERLPDAPAIGGVPVSDDARRWFSVVTPAGEFAAPPEPASAWMPLGLLAAALTGLLAMSAALYRYRGLKPARVDLNVRRLRRGVVGYAGHVASRLKRAPGSFRLPVKAPDGAASVAAYLERAQQTVERLGSAGPLREVLRDELRVVRQRLEAAIKASEEEKSAGAASPPKAPAMFRALVRDLERICRISDSAAASLSGQANVIAMPRTRAEAYTLLGVNPDVSEAVLKKLSDALRMSWHPDLARDDSDRAMREDRIKQINIALELIRSEKQAA